MKGRIILVAVIFLSSILCAQSSAQHRKTGLLDANRVKTVITNYGVLAQPSAGINRGAWKHATNGYFGDLSFMLGVELPIKDYDGNGSFDTLHGVLITPVSRPGGGKVIDGYFSGMEPLPGFAATTSGTTQNIALSDIPATWPATWPDHPEFPANSWNGLLGLNTFIPGREAVYALDDANERKYFNMYGFLPDSTMPTRKGYGLNITVRIIQSTLPELEDALIFVYDIKNNSKYNYNKVFLASLCGSYIGIEANEWDDDYTVIYPKDDFIVSGDFDQRINPASNPNWIGRPGKYGMTFIDAPGKQKIASFDYFAPASDIQMANDESLWSRLTPGRRRTANSIMYQPDSTAKILRGEDGDDMHGSHYFPLPQGATKRIVSVLAFGTNNHDIYDKILAAAGLYHSNFSATAMHDKIHITSHMNQPTLTGNSEITWSSTLPASYFVDIAYSTDNGESWTDVVTNTSNTGNYTWNTTGFADSKVGKLRIVLKDTDGNKIGVNKSSHFTLNNSGNNGKPYLAFLNIHENQEITTSLYDMQILAADAEDSQLILKVYAKEAGAADSLLILNRTVLSSPEPQSIVVNVGLPPNTNTLSLTGYIYDNSNASGVCVSEIFRKQTTTNFLNTANYGFVSGYTTASVRVRIADSAQIKSSNYTITFDDTTYSGSSKLFSVYNNSNGTYAVRNTKLVMNGESAMFDGMRLYTQDFFSAKDTNKSGWHTTNTPALPLLQFAGILNNSPLKTRKPPHDYMLVFSDEYNDSSNNLDALLGSTFPVYTRLNYKAYRLTNSGAERIQFAHISNSTTSSDTLDRDDYIVLSNQNGTSLNWLLGFYSTGQAYIPHGGDTLYFYTTKGLSVYDTLRLTNLVVNNDAAVAPRTYDVSQNYPNPFNPTTTINYTVPVTARVRLVIYNSLGQQIMEVLHAEHSAGSYHVPVDMSAFASGVYIYHVSIGEKQFSRKMLLLK